MEASDVDGDLGTRDVRGGARADSTARRPRRGECSGCRATARDEPTQRQTSMYATTRAASTVLEGEHHAERPWRPMVERPL